MHQNEFGVDLYIQQWRLERFKGKFDKFLKDLQASHDLNEFLSMKIKEYENIGKLQDASE